MQILSYNKFLIKMVDTFSLYDQITNKTITFSISGPIPFKGGLFRYEVYDSKGRIYDTLDSLPNNVDVAIESFKRRQKAIGELDLVGDQTKIFRKSLDENLNKIRDVRSGRKKSEYNIRTPGIEAPIDLRIKYKGLKIGLEMLDQLDSIEKRLEEIIKKD